MMLNLIFHSLMFLIRGMTSFWRPCDKGSYVFSLKMLMRSLVATTCVANQMHCCHTIRKWERCESMQDILVFKERF
jgi:hypothetical protein